MNSTLEQLIETFEHVNPQQFKIRTNINQRCRRCIGNCKQNHYSLDSEYNELRTVINNMRRSMLNNTNRPPVNLNEINCERCGLKGHNREVCNNKLYYWNR